MIETEDVKHSVGGSLVRPKKNTTSKGSQRNETYAEFQKRQSPPTAPTKEKIPTVGDELVTLLHESGGERSGVSLDLLGVHLEFGGGGVLESHAQRADLVVVGPTLKSGEHSLVDAHLSVRAQRTGARKTSLLSNENPALASHRIGSE